MKIKDEKQKHNHKLTEILKICIFSLLMIAPLLASVSQMLYVTLNKNAKDSYYGETINEEQINNISYDNLTNYITYTFNNPILNNIDAPDSVITSFIVENVVDNLGNVGADISTTNKILFYLNSQKNPRISFYLDNTILGTIVPNTNTYNFNFRLLSIRDKNLNEWLNDYDLFYQTTYNRYSYLDNAFYYGVDQMTKSDLFNWTQNTAIYTGVKAMTDNLQIQTNAIAILIVYWFILTIIYIIIDIVIKCFTTITHMIFRAD